jgi:hypothetical protein
MRCDFHFGTFEPVAQESRTQLGLADSLSVKVYLGRRANIIALFFLFNRNKFILSYIVFGPLIYRKID